MKTVLVTGASGFIGRQTLASLAQRGYAVHAISRLLQTNSDLAQWHQADVLDEAGMEKLVATIQPTHLLHMAWTTEHGVYWNSPANTPWLTASLKLLENFGRSAGERAVGIGTCAEYDWHSEAPFREEMTPIRPCTLYGSAKAALGMMQTQLGRSHGFSQAWCRPFFLYGPGEDSARLVPSLTKAILQDQIPVCREPSAVRDFLHVADAAEAIVTVLDSNHTGPVNIGSGEGVRLGDLAEIICNSRVLKTSFCKLPELQPNVYPVVGDVSILTSLGFRAKHSLQSGLAEALEWWRPRIMEKELVP